MKLYLALVVSMATMAVSACSSAPPQQAPLTQVRQQATDVLAQTREFKGALDRGNLSTAKRYAEHLVNLIEGETGDHYGDSDEDGTVGDSGDGHGLLTYVGDVGNVVGGERTGALTNLTVAQLRRIIRESLMVIDATEVSSVSGSGSKALTEAQQLLNDSVKRIEDTAARKGVVPEAIPEISMPDVSTEPLTVTVFMDQFRFADQVVTVEKGWTVVWSNKDVPRHSAIGDDGTFTSEVLGRAESFSFTFDRSGTFPYYCRFHGDAGGTGMAGTVVVK